MRASGVLVKRLVPALLLVGVGALRGSGQDVVSTPRPPLVPYTIDWGNPLPPLVDFSEYLTKPAGETGFIRVGDGKLLRPDGSRFRIWGVNITSGFCFPSHEESAAMADDLARMGVNCVRFHGLDSNWGGSAIDQSRDDTQHLDETNLERFDYLVWQLQQRGIYSNLNLNVFRKYKAGDGVRDFEPLYFGKSATYFNPRLLELQRDYARKLLTHHNPYTGHEYRHEPAVLCVELVNENSVLEGWVNGRLIGQDEEHPGTWSPIPVSYAQELTGLLNDWFRELYPAELLTTWRQAAGVGADAPIPCLRPDQFAQASPERFRAEAEFYYSLEERFFADMRQLLKEELGVRSLVVGTADHNDWYCGYSHIEANLQLDFVDGHGYWQHPQIGEVTRITNTPMVNDPGDSTIVQFARSPVAGLPYTISETNHPFPHEYACEGIPALTAYALFNDWDGIYWFCYDRGPMQRGDNVPRSAWFDMSVDPVKVTQIAACAPLWHRQDVAMARETILRSYTHDEIMERLRADRGRERPFFSPGFARTTPLMHATRFTLEDEPASPYPPEPIPNAIVADTGELGWFGAADQRGVIVVDTPRSQALIGFVAGSGRHTQNLTTSLANPFCALQLTVLDDQSLAGSRRLLLTTTALATNAGLEWEGDRKTVRSWGDGPTVIEPVTGEITLMGLRGDVPVRMTALTVTGRPQREPVVVPVQAGRARLQLSAEPCTWYLLERVD